MVTTRVAITLLKTLFEIRSDWALKPVLLLNTNRGTEELEYPFASQT